jgi:regulator of sigma E protease
VNVVVSIAGLAFLVLIHELGHFLVARAVGMRPRKFYLFFPPALAKTVRNGIEYGIGTIPLGGYVKIPGMHRPAARDLESHFAAAIDEAPWLDRPLAEVKRALTDGDLDRARDALPELTAALERAELSEHARRAAQNGLVDVGDALSSDAYWRAPAWKRIAVIVAGPATNLLFCVAMLAVVFAVGVPTDPTRVVDRVAAGTPAAAAGLEPGDEIVAVDGRETATFDDVSREIRGSGGRPIVVTVERDGRRVDLGPLAAEVVDGRYRIGFRPEPQYESYGAGGSITRAFEETGRVTVEIGKALGRLVTGSGREDVSSPIGIVQGSSEALEQGFRYYLGILALISLSLALMNLLPLLPLDGGHILFSVLEKVRRRAIAREAYERASVIGIALVLLLFVIGLSNDVGRLG